MSKNTEQDVLLSICIPTYNRADIVSECVKRCLSINIPSIELVVCDNCSTDDTKEKLEVFHDDRLKYFRNTQNIGYRNIHEVMRRATGKYCFILSDEDDIDPVSLKKVCAVLEEETEKGIVFTNFCVEDRKIKSNYTKGEQAIIHMGLKMPGYISGIIFFRKAVLEVEEQIQENSIYYQLFPHNYIGLLIAGRYDTMIVKEKTVKEGVRRGKVDNVAQKTKVLGMHWEPQSRREQFLGKIEVLQQIKLSESAKTVIANNLLDDYHYMMVFGYYHIIIEEMQNWELPENRKALIEKDREKSRKEWLNYSNEVFRELKTVLEKTYLGKNYTWMLLKHGSAMAGYVKVLIKKKIRTGKIR